VTRLIALAAKKEPKIICLAEHWLPGRRAELSDALPGVQKLAREFGIWIVAGADFTRREGRTFIESVVFDPAGDEVGRQLKTHLFGLEKKVAKPGSEFRIFDLGDGHRFGITICHDLVYPEVARMFALRGADLIFAPAMIGQDGIGPWHLYLQARSLENRIPIVSPNVLMPPRFRGGSRILTLTSKGPIVYTSFVARGGTSEGVFQAEIDLESAKTYRLARLRDRRPEIYSGLQGN